MVNRRQETGDLFLDLPRQLILYTNGIPRYFITSARGYKNDFFWLWNDVIVFIKDLPFSVLCSNKLPLNLYFQTNWVGRGN